MISFKTLPFLQLFTIQIKEYIRDPGILFWALGFPISMAYVLGVAFSSGNIKTNSIAVVLNGQERIAIEQMLTGVDRDRFTVRYVASEGEASHLIQRGRISFYMMRNRDGENFRYYFDPANEQSLLAYHQFKEALRRDSGADLVVLRGKGERYIDFLIPGLLAMGLMNSALWGSGWTLIEYRMKKLLRRMAATPMRKWEFFLGHIMTRLLLSVLEFVFLWIFALLMFDLPFQGSLAGLATVFLAGNLGFNGIAILTASRTDNSRIGNGLINAVTFPMMLLSGIFFSYENFPLWAVEMIRYLPLTLLADSLRALFIEGAGFGDVLIPSLILLTYGGISFATGLKCFRWS